MAGLVQREMTQIRHVQPGREREGIGRLDLARRRRLVADVRVDEHVAGERAEVGRRRERGARVAVLPRPLEAEDRDADHRRAGRRVVESAQRVVDAEVAEPDVGHRGPGVEGGLERLAQARQRQGRPPVAEGGLRVVVRQLVDTLAGAVRQAGRAAGRAGRHEAPGHLAPGAARHVRGAPFQHLARSLQRRHRKRLCRQGGDGTGDDQRHGSAASHGPAAGYFSWMRPR